MKIKYISFVIFGITGILLMLILVLRVYNDYARKQNIVNRLTEIVLALNSYYENENHYPSPTLYNENQVIGSWRFALLPYLEQVKDKETYKVPWEEGLYSKVLHPCFCWSSKINSSGFYDTNVLAVIGTNTQFELHKSENATKAILLLGVGKTNVPWGMSGDFEVDSKGFPKGKLPPPIDGKWYGVVWNDGSVWLLDKSVPIEKLQLFFILDDEKGYNPNTVLAAYRIE